MATKRTKAKRQSGHPTSSPELEKYIKDREHSVNAWLARFTLRLLAADVRKVQIDYSGYGDSGQIDRFRFLDADGNEMPEDVISHEKLPGFEQFVYDLMDTRGWDVNNEGSQGSITWDLTQDLLTHHHEANYMSHDDTDFEGIEDLKASLAPDTYA